jgi:hypothetical protein
MDRISDSGSDDVGSTPAGDTKRADRKISSLFYALYDQNVGETA